MRFNPQKCGFCVDSGKLLGLILSHHGIEVDKNKIDVIVSMPPHRNISQLRSL